MGGKLRLKDGSKVVVVGGGPAGSFFANFALHMAKKQGINISLTIFDRRSFSKSGQVGCNMCAGVISESLYAKLQNANIVLPDIKVQQDIKGYYFQTLDCGLQLFYPEKRHVPHIVTVFRGGGPLSQNQHENISFDDYILKHAEGHGAKVVHGTVREIDLPHEFGDPVNLVVIKDGVRETMQADLIVGAFGLNSVIAKRIVGPGVKYRPPRSMRACNAELHLGKEYIKERFDGNIYCFSLGIDPIKFAAFTPKGDYLTVSLVGKRDVTKAHLVKFLSHPIVKDMLPEGWKIPTTLCICFPKIPVTHASSPFSDRMVMIGDASISRFYKSGIESAFTTAELAAKSAFEHGVTGAAFKHNYYSKAKKLLGRDNVYGHLIYGLNGFVTSRRGFVSPYLERAKAHKGSWTSDRMNESLWGMVTGNIQYKTIFFKLASLRFQTMLLPTTIEALGRCAIAAIKESSENKSKKGLRVSEKMGMGPLGDGDTAVVIGGGPAGASCAISLLSRAKAKGINLKVVLYEWKPFDNHVHNECAGVLSPPIKKILEEDVGVPFPEHLVESHIKGYYLHTDDSEIKLEGGADEVSFGVLRQKFDTYMIEQAEKAGAEVIRSKVTDIEITPEKVTVYSETKHTRAEVVVGAFGLEEGSGLIFERETPYRTPRHLLTILTKYHCEGDDSQKLKERGDYIHAFLTSNKDIEFGAVTPKADHFTINIAGEAIHSHSIERFLELKSVQAVLPDKFKFNIDKLDFHRGCFPISPAKSLFGDRYVAIGDAAGLIRPFKGKGVNSGCLMGVKAAEVMMNTGVSKAAFNEYYKHFSEIVDDIPYARTVRRMVIEAANRGHLSLLVNLAKEDKAMKNALFYSVAGTKSYKKIVNETKSVGLALKVIKGLFFKSGDAK